MRKPARMKLPVCEVVEVRIAPESEAVGGSAEEEHVRVAPAHHVGGVAAAAEVRARVVPGPVVTGLKP